MQVIENLRDIIYEEVTTDYGWGKYGDFKVLIRRKDGYINASKLCLEGGKRFKDWLETIHSRKLIKVCESQGVITPCDSIQNVANELRGTYVHQDLVPHIASWISADFAIKVSRIVNNMIVREYRETIREKTEKIDSLEREMKEFILDSHKREEDARKFREESARRDEEARKFREESARREEEARRRHQEQKILLERAEQDRAIMQAKLDLANENLLEAVYGVDRANRNVLGLHKKLDKTCDMYVPPEHLRPKDVETYAIFYCDHTHRGRVYTQTRARPFHLNRRIKELRDMYGAEFREVLRITPVANSRSLASEFERRIQEQGLNFDQTHQRIIIPDNAAFGETAMADLAREVFGERREQVGAAENVPMVTFKVENGGALQLIEEPVAAIDNPVAAIIDPDAAINDPDAAIIDPDAAAQQDYDQELRELLASRLDDLRDLARAFPRDIKTYGGYSKLSKIDLAHWILKRRGLERPHQ